MHETSWKRVKFEYFDFFVLSFRRKKVTVKVKSESEWVSVCMREDKVLVIDGLLITVASCDI